MFKNRGQWLTLSLCLCQWASFTVICAGQSSDIESVDRAIRNVADYWSPPLTTEFDDQLPVVVATNDEGKVTQVQLLAQRQPSTRMAQRQRRRNNSTSTSGLSSVPFMIGDTGSGSCGALTFAGTSLASVEHPTFGCSRLNIAENNSALTQDREFISYRHYHNLSDTNVFGSANSINSEQFTLGMERLLFRDDLSIELRVPIAYDLNSSLDIVSTPATKNLPVSDRNGEFGNISVLLKKMLIQRRDWIVSAGVAVNIPTADDVSINAVVDDVIPVFVTPPVSAAVDFTFTSLTTNDTVNLSPFLAWLHNHDGRWFHQGFLQVDIPLNRSSATFDVTGSITPPGPFLPAPLATTATGPVDQQTLLRLNLGWGYWFYQGTHCDLLKGIAGIFEVHYTSTLDDANPFTTQIATITDGGFLSFPVNLAIGNQTDNIDIVNLTTGLTFDLDAILVTHGFTAPVSTGANKPFDFEYNLQIQHRY